MDCSPPDSKVHGILQARILEWVAFPFFRGSSQPRDRTQVSCITDRFFTTWATREAPFHPNGSINVASISDKSNSLTIMWMLVIMWRPYNVHKILFFPLLQYINIFQGTEAQGAKGTFSVVFHMCSPPLSTNPAALSFETLSFPGKQQQKTTQAKLPRISRRDNKCAHFITSHHHNNKPSLLNRSPSR